MDRFERIAKIIALLSCSIGVIALLYIYVPSMRAAGLESIDRCTFDDHADPQCLRAAVEALLARYSAVDVMDYVTASTSPVNVTNQCHPIGHIVGELTYKKTGSIEQALSLCSPTCRSACTHGAIGAGILSEMDASYSEEDIAHAGENELESYAATYCAQRSSICHAIGHVAYIATSDEASAVKICDVARDSFFRESCYQGVFMERSGSYRDSLFPAGDLPQPKIKSGDYTYPCTSVGEQYRHACFIFLNAYQKPLFAADGITDPSAQLEKAASTCEALPARDRAFCFEGIGTARTLFRYPDLHSPRIQEFCANLESPADRDACTLGLVPQFQYDELRGLMQFCDAIPEADRREICYDAAYLSVQDRRTTDQDIGRMCGDDAACTDRYAQFMKKRSSIPDYRFGLYGK